jgi:hypothetical protein
MVYLCRECNALKPDSTLTAFIEKEGRDLAKILDALRQLGKDVTRAHPLPELSLLAAEVPSRIDFNVVSNFGLAGQDVTLSLILFGERILHGHFHAAR